MRSLYVREVLHEIFGNVNSNHNSNCTFPLDAEDEASGPYDFDINNYDLNFVFRGILIPIITLFGIPANVLSVIVLSHPKLRSPMTIMLLCLSISDLFVIGAYFPIACVNIVLNRFKLFPLYFSHIRPTIFPYVFSIADTAQMSSIYFTVIITLERYIAVCHPLKARSLCTRSSAIKASIAIISISIIYNLPRWFSYESVPVLNCDDVVMWYDIRNTEFGGGNSFSTYYKLWGFAIITFAFPFGTLSFFNLAIWRVVKKHRTRRSSISSTMARETREDIQLAILFMGIVTTFLICFSPYLGWAVCESFGIQFPQFLEPIINAMELFSHSSNFIFYYAFGTRFRRQLWKTLGLNKERRDSRINSSGCVTSSDSATCTSSIPSDSINEDDKRNPPWKEENGIGYVNKTFNENETDAPDSCVSLKTVQSVV